MAAERHDAAEVARLLAAQIHTLAAELLPAGRKDGPRWRCGSVAGEPGQSLAVGLSGMRAGRWRDYSSGEGGDALDLVAACRFGGDKRDALRWARAWLGLGSPAEHVRRASPAPAPRPAPAAEAEREEAERIRRLALAIFLDAAPSLRGTPAEAYLAARSIPIAEMGRQPAALRFAPSLRCAEAGRPLPALVAAVIGPDGDFRAVHRTWLAQDAAGIWRKAPLQNAKRSLGGIAGGHIPLWRGASGKPLREAPDGETVVIGEGIETCLSVAVCAPELRVIAGVAGFNLGLVRLPEAVRTVILLADNDAPDSPAAKAFLRAVRDHQAAGRMVRIARAPVGKDFNDLLAMASDAA